MRFPFNYQGHMGLKNRINIINIKINTTKNVLSAIDLVSQANSTTPI